MTLLEILELAGSGGMIIFLLLMLIEWTPIKVNPIGWFGERFNTSTKKEIQKVNDNLTESINEVKHELYAHEAEGFRRTILSFADEIMRGKIAPHDMWRDVLKMCTKYEHLIDTQGLINGDATEAIEYLRDEYQNCCHKGNFKDFPK